MNASSIRHNYTKLFTITSEERCFIILWLILKMIHFLLSTNAWQLIVLHCAAWRVSKSEMLWSNCLKQRNTTIDKESISQRDTRLFFVIISQGECERVWSNYGDVFNRFRYLLKHAFRQYRVSNQNTDDFPEILRETQKWIDRNVLEEKMFVMCPASFTFLIKRYKCIKWIKKARAKSRFSKIEAKNLKQRWINWHRLIAKVIISLLKVNHCWYQQKYKQYLQKK